MSDPVAAPTAGLVFDDRFLQHNPGLYPLWSTGEPYPFVDPVRHLSNHRLVMRTKHLLDLSGLADDLAQIPARQATVEEVARYHDPAYIDRVREISAAGGGETGDGAPAGPGSYQIALLAAGGGLAAVDAAAAGPTRRLFVNCRPPGHHAVAGKGMGYCIFNNVVLAAHHARSVHGFDRILIVDWDVHHGNGTQDAFYADPGVAFVSLHQEGLYPEGSGTLDQVGEGEAAGTNVNVPLPPGCGDAAYLAAFDRVVLPIAHAFRPQLVLVSAGQDASTMDQHGRMCLTTDGYRRMTEAMIALADDHADGRIVILQEGGYSEIYGPYCGLAIVETLAGRRTGLPEPLDPARLAEQPPAKQVGLDAAAAIGAAAQRYAEYWDGLE